MTLQDIVQGFVFITLPWLAVEVIAHQGWWRSIDRRWLAGRGLGQRRKRSPVALHGLHDATPTFTRGLLWIKAETNALNRLPTSLLLRLDVGRSQRRRTIRFIYDVGIVFGLLSLIISLAVIVFGAFELIGQLVNAFDINDDGKLSHLSRRQILPAGHDELGKADKAAANSLFVVHIVPLIPGLTLPWSHLFPLAIALAATQVIHEAGHAISGALHNHEPQGMGVMLLYPLIPGAFVSLPVEASQAGNDEFDGEERRTEASRMRLQIIAAGVWHNAITFIFLALLLYSPLGTAGTYALWRDARAVRVRNVDSLSPLSAHLPTNSLVTALDDVRLDDVADSKRREEAWSTYLSYVEGGKSTAKRGWCVAETDWQSAKTGCCDALETAKTADANDNQSAEVCFVTLSTDGQRNACLDPFKTLTGARSIRCSSACASSTAGRPQICVLPDEREQLLRITIRRPDGAEPKTVLFQGDRGTVLNSVAVSQHVFRLGSALFLERLLEVCIHIVRYTYTLSLAMAIFNMLPLPTLDGDAFLLVVLGLLAQRMKGGRHARRRLSRSSEATQRSADGVQHDDQMELSTFGTMRHLHPSRRQVGAGTKADESLLVQLHSRLRWLTLALTVFVIGGSVLVHLLEA